MKLLFHVTIGQKTKSSYYDDEQGKVVEFDCLNEIKGVFHTWASTQVFVNSALDAFDNITVNIRVEYESEVEKNGMEL